MAAPGVFEGEVLAALQGAIFEGGGDFPAHEVMKNFPTEAEAREALGGRAQRIRWTEHTHYWVLDYTLE